MPRLPRGQFSLLALAAALGGVPLATLNAAELPPFAVDPALLGQSAPTQSTAPAAPAAQASPVTPPASVSADTAADGSPGSGTGNAAEAASKKTAAKKKEKGQAVQAPAQASTQAAESTAAAPAKDNAAAVSDTAAAPASGAPMPAAVGSLPAGNDAVPKAASRPAAAPSDGTARNMTVFKVDPALLGAPGAAPVTATAVARPTDAQDGKAAAATTDASGPRAVATVRGGKKKKNGLVPGQVMPESAVAAADAGPASRTVAPSRPGGVLASNMTPFRVDPALLDPADRALAPVAADAPAVVEVTQPRLAGASGKKAKPEPKISVVPGVTAGGVYLPPLYAGDAEDRKTVPVYVTADRVDGTSGVQSVARGNADLIKADSRLRADEIVYREEEDEVEATGNVILTRESEKVTGPHLKLKLGDSVGAFDSPVFEMAPRPFKPPVATTGIAYGADSGPRASKGEPQPGYGEAERLDFLGEEHYHLDKATYSSCSPDTGARDWYAKIALLDLNYAENLGEGEDGTVYFKGVPILYSPWLSFSLNRQRKSGFLVPTWGTSTNSGMEFSLPYYWNIAPEMDATITPRIMGRRGTQFSGEFRYIGNDVPSIVGPSYYGTINAEILPNDRLTGTERHLYSIVHNQNFGNGFSGNLNVTGVSDDSYFTDLSTTVSTIAQTNLVRQGTLSYGAGWWSASVLVQRYQTLQPVGQTITKPYERLPQVSLSAVRPDLPLGLAFNFSGEYTQFHDPNGGVEGKRITYYPQLSLPLQTAAFYVTPKIGVHSTRYDLEQQTVGLPTSLNRSVPIFSVDSGVVFERETAYQGRDLIQTLEPRLYYLRVPYRDQSQFPVFDTGVADYNFAQIFSENTFSGGDRIADANQLTLAVSSRLISPVSGAELAKVAVGQRWYFSDQTVLLPGQVARTSRLADYLGALSVQMERGYSVDGAIEYNPTDQRLQKLNTSLRYQPETGRIINAGYRYSRDLASPIHQIDVSGQWPVGGGWSAVGRYNYSIQDKRLVENILGMEYNESCWAVRFVVQRVATTTGQVNNIFFAQLQLNGFSSLGSSPLGVLRRSVQGYDKVVAEPDEENDDQ